MFALQTIISDCFHQEAAEQEAKRKAAEEKRAFFQRSRQNAKNKKKNKNMKMRADADEEEDSDPWGGKVRESEDEKDVKKDVTAPKRGYPLTPQVRHTQWASQIGLFMFVGLNRKYAIKYADILLTYNLTVVDGPAR